MKVVGQRRRGMRGKGAFEAADGFLKLVLKLREGKPFIPPGVYKFKSFEEMEAWRLKMTLGKTPGLPR